jgi:hypothetical protein
MAGGAGFAMTLTIPNLDDRTYDDLVAEAMALIPTLAPEWTNHNASDPGITLLELLAYVTEALVYRVNRVDIESRVAFLDLLRGSDDEPIEFAASASPDEVDAAIREVVSELSRPQRAVTKNDLEVLSRRAAAAIYGEDVHTFCVPGAAIAKTREGTRLRERPSDLTVIVVPPGNPFGTHDADVLTRIRDALLPSCLLGTRLHVTDTLYVTIAVRASIVTRASRRPDEWREIAQARLDRYFSPRPSNDPDGPGWPFGRSVHASDVADALLEWNEVDSVDDVLFVALWTAPRDALTDDDTVGVQVGVLSSVGKSTRIGASPALGTDRLLEAKRLNGIALRPYELARVVIAPGGLRVSRQRESDHA